MSGLDEPNWAWWAAMEEARLRVAEEDERNEHEDEDEDENEDEKYGPNFYINDEFNF